MAALSHEEFVASETDSDSDFEGFEEQDLQQAAVTVARKERQLQELLESSEGELSDLVYDAESESETEPVEAEPGPRRVGRAGRGDAVPQTIWRDVKPSDEEAGVPDDDATAGARAYNEVPGPQYVPRLCVKPIEFFSLFFTTAILQFICGETDRYAKEKEEAYTRLIEENAEKKSKTFERLMGWWNQTGGMTLIRLKAVLGLLLNMCMVKKPRMRDYWNLKDKWQRTPGFPEIMARDKFFTCLQFLHFNDNSKAKPRDDPGYDPLHKVRPLIDHINRTFARLYTLRRFISIDESLIGLKNRTKLMQYLPNKKHHRWGIKLWVLCESATGYTYRFVIYTGKALANKPASQFGQSYDVVMDLMKGLFDSAYVLVVDNFYTSVVLAKNLLNKGTYMVGTVRRNRKYLPKVLTQAKLKPAERKYCKSGDMLMCAFREKKSQTKPVLLMSTCSKPRDVNVTRASGKPAVVPEVVDTYNRHMGGVDLADQKVYAYEDERRSYKWYKKVFHNILHRACLNAYILYCQTMEQRKESHRDEPDFRAKDYRVISREKFIKSIIDDLIGDFSDRGRIINSEAMHSCKLEKLPKVNSNKGLLRQVERDCIMCSRRQAGQRKRSCWYCSACNVGLCRECFPKHVLEKSKEL